MQCAGFCLQMAGCDAALTWPLVPLLGDADCCGVNLRLDAAVQSTDRQTG